MQKCLAEITGSGYKSMAKIANLGDNKVYIVPASGPPIRGQYSKGRSSRFQGDLYFQLPQGPGDEGVLRSGISKSLIVRDPLRGQHGQTNQNIPM